MAVIPFDPVQSVRPDIQGTPYQSDQAPAAAFGTAGQALQGAGQAGMRAADAGTEIATRQAALHNQIAANAAFNQLEDGTFNLQFGDPNKPGDGGFYGMRGEEALRAYPEKVKAMQDLRDQISQGLNPMQQIQFDQFSRRYVAMNQQQMGMHRAQQQLVWGDQTAQATQSLALRGAGSFANDDTRFNASMADGLIAIDHQAAVNGWAPDMIAAKKAAFTSEAQMARITRMSVDDPVSAKNYLDQHASDLQPAAFAQLSERLQAQSDRAQGEGVAQSVIGGGPVPQYSGAVSDLTRKEAVAQGVDPSTALATAQIESKMGTAPNRPGSQYQGVFQMGPDAWAARGGTPDQRGDVGAQVHFGVANLAHAQTVAADAMGGQAPGWATYLVHQQGDAGGAALLKADPTENAVAALAPAYGGNQAAAQRAIVQNGGSADMTVGQFQGVWQSRFHMAGGNGAMPNQGSDDALQARLSQVRDMAQKQGLSFVAEQHAESLVIADHSRQQAQGAQEREGLRSSMQDLVPALEQGMDAPIPETRIRAAFPQDQADRMMMELNVARGAGQLFKGVQFASPEQEQQARAMLETPGTVQADGIRVRRGQLTGPGINPVSLPGDGGVASPAANPEDPSAMRMRLQVANRYEQLLAQKHQALAADPAAYALQSPDVRAAAAQGNPADPGFIAKSIGLQKQLGVPDDQTRVLTNGQVGQLVSKLQKVDPEQGDAGMELDKLAQSYGQQWPRVFGEMVEHGKLNPDYQMLAAMDGPGQAGGRVDMQRMLSLTAAKGGVKALETGAGEDAVKDIKQNIDGQLAEFQATTRYNTGGADLYDHVHDAVQHLASYYAMQGQGSGAALSSATQAVLGRYDFDGSMRVPKGQMADAKAATSAALDALRPEDLGPVGGNPLLSGGERADIVLNAAKANPLWVPNKDDSGLVLMSRLRNGAQPITVRRADGSPVEVRFDAMRYSGPTPAPAPQTGQAAPGGT